MFGKILSFRRPSANILTSRDYVDLDTLIPTHLPYCNIPKTKLFNDKVYQEDHLHAHLNSEETETEEDDDALHLAPSQEYLTPPSQVSSFERLWNLMLSRSHNKEIQAPEKDGENNNVPTHSVTRLHDALEKQIQLLNELIQRQIVHCIRILNYPLAATTVSGNILNQEQVGFTDAICFVTNIAIRNVAEKVEAGQLYLGSLDVELLRKNFYNLTESIEALRRTRSKIFSQFHKQIKVLLESLIKTNELSYERSASSLFIMPSKPLIELNKGDANSDSFESMFWSNYIGITSKLVQADSEASRSPSKFLHNDLEILWEASKRETISLRGESEETFELSLIDIRTQLRIVGCMIDLATSNFKSVDQALRKAGNDFVEGKKILKELEQNIRISNLNTGEIEEILKVLHVSAATTIKFLKEIEKSTRFSRLVISEGIHKLRFVLGQTKDTKVQELALKPPYLKLLFSINCEPGILPLQKNTRPTAAVMVIKSATDLSPTNTASHSQTTLDIDDGNVRVNSELRLSHSETEAIVFKGEEKTLGVIGLENEKLQETQENAPENRPVLSQKSSSVSHYPLNRPHPTVIGSGGELSALATMINDSFCQAYSWISLPSAAAWEEDGKIPFILGLCTVLIKALCNARPYWEIPGDYQNAIARAIKLFNDATNFGNKKKDYVRDIAKELCITAELLSRWLKILQVSNEKTGSRAFPSQNLYPDSRFLAQSEEEQSANTAVWQINWTGNEEGLIVKQMEAMRKVNFASLKLTRKCSLILDILYFATRMYTETGAILRQGEQCIQTANKQLRNLEKKMSKYLKTHTVAAEELQYYGAHLLHVKGAHTTAVELLGKLNSTMSQVAPLMFVITSYINAQNKLESLRTLPNTKDKARTRKSITVKIQQAEDYMLNISTVPLVVHVPIQSKCRRGAMYSRN